MCVCVLGGGQDKPAWTAYPGLKITRVGARYPRISSPGGGGGASCPGWGGGQDKLLHRLSASDGQKTDISNVVSFIGI